METYYEVWVQDYDTFGEGETHIDRRFTNRDAAETYAALVNKGWGRRARVESMTPDFDVLDMTADEVAKHFSEYGNPLSYEDIQGFVKKMD